MASKDVYFVPCSMEPTSPEPVPKTDADVDQGYSNFLPPLPQPTPTDFGNLFVQDKEKASARRHKPGHIPRPRNAFILFRCDFIQQRVPEDLINDHRDLSRLAGCVWRKMSDGQKQPWFEKAEVERRYHSEVFPEYRYSPAIPDRPKRVYRKRKPFVPEEVLLSYPHRHSDPPRSPAQRPVPRILIASSSASKTHFQPPIALVGSCTSTPHWQYPDIPQSYPDHQQDPLMLQSNQTIGLERLHFPSPGAHCSGFVNISEQISDTIPDWEFNHPESSAYYYRGYWQAPKTESAQGAITSESPEQDPMNSSLRESGSLYNMWKSLGMFHDQAFNSDANQEVTSDSRYSYSEYPEVYSPPITPRADVINSHFPTRSP